MLDGDTIAGAGAIRAHAKLFDTDRQAVIATTVSGEIVYWNGAAEAIYGWKESEVSGRYVNHVTPTEMSRGDGERIMKALQAGRTWAGHFRVRSRAGKEFGVKVRDIPLRGGSGELIGIIGISTPTADTSVDGTPPAP
jgi:PAS domain S-box-containing protein